jgi:hypothetical protein
MTQLSRQNPEIIKGIFNRNANRVYLFLAAHNMRIVLIRGTTVLFQEDGCLLGCSAV